ncbi:MAG: bifunctional DNA primase/polymerase, partial [Phycisphaeraceae bacterium]
MDLQEEVRRGHGRGWSFTKLSGKRPVLKQWQTAPPASLEQVLAWAEAGNVGLRTGPISGIVVIDIEQNAQKRPDDFPPTVTVETGGGGWHLYYQTRVPIQGIVGMIKKSGELQGI